MMAALLRRLLPLDDEAGAAVEPFARRRLENWNGIAVGEIRAVALLSGSGHETA